MCYTLCEIPTSFNQGMIQLGWNKCLQGRQTIVSSFSIFVSHTQQTGSFAISTGVGCLWTMFSMKSLEVGGGPY